MKTNEYKKRSLIKVSFSFISRFTDFFNKSKQAELNQQLTKNTIKIGPWLEMNVSER